MLHVLYRLARHHDLDLVGVAVVVCLFGGYTLFSIASHASRVPAERRLLWLGMGAVAGGTTIWATHFIAMLAYHDDMAAHYSPGLTVASVLVAIFGTMLSLLLSRTVRTTWARVSAGIVTGATIATMHFVGMGAMSTERYMRYDHAAVLWSVALGTLATTIAIAGLRKVPGGYLRSGLSALLFTAGVAIIHFGAMAAMQMPVAMPHGPAADGGNAVLAIAVTLGVLLVTMLSFASERIAALGMQRDVDEAERIRSLADISLEGLIVLDDAGVAIDANRRMEELLGRPAAGLPIAAILPKVHPGVFAGDLQSESAESELIRADGTRMKVEVLVHRASHLRRPALVVVVRDLTERVEAERRIRHAANHDALTRLPNRVLFHDRLEQALARTTRTGGKTALLYIDLDGFKSVNDVFGHSKGDEVLRGVAALLESTTRAGDTLARLGGDEFAIIQSDCEQPGGAEALAGRLVAEVERVYGSGRGDVSLGVSIGIAIAPDDALEPSTLVRHADTALYKAKEAGRGTWRFFEAAMDDALRARHSIESALRQALLGGDIVLAYQPQMNADTGEITGFEALARWHHPVHGMIPPDVFIPIAEQSGLIVQLGTWVLTEACREATRWTQPLRIAVNLSPVQFQQGALTRRVQAILADTGLAPERLELEITETALMRDRDATIATLEELKAMGIRIAMDDFGTGYSSLSNLQSFPFDKIKVDRSFVSSIMDDDKASSIVKAVIGLGHSLALPIVAEGVENSQQLDMLRAERCTEIQGYLVGRPLPISAFRHIIDRDDHDATLAA